MTNDVVTQLKAHLEVAIAFAEGVKGRALLDPKDIHWTEQLIANWKAALGLPDEPGARNSEDASRSSAYWKDELLAANHENERLRAALRECAETRNGQLDANTMTRIARAALADQQGAAQKSEACQHSYQHIEMLKCSKCCDLVEFAGG